jgi:hypothetical protein
MWDHNQRFHPDHTHVWGPSTYEWEQAGTPFIIPLSGGVRGTRPVTVERCTVCAVGKDENREGMCE